MDTSEILNRQKEKSTFIGRKKSFVLKKENKNKFMKNSVEPIVSNSENTERCASESESEMNPSVLTANKENKEMDITQKDMLKTTDDLENDNEIKNLSDDGCIETPVKEKERKKSHDELCFESVINDGETSQLYDLGPFGISVLTKIIQEANRFHIPICIVKKKKAEKITLSKNEEALQFKLVQQLNEIYKEMTPYISKKTKPKKYSQLLEKKKKAQKKLNELSNSHNKYSYHLYINCSRIEFVEEIRKDSYPVDIQLQKTHKSMIETAFEGGAKLCNLETEVSENDLKIPGNYGSLATFTMHGKDYFETHIQTRTYYKLRNLDGCPVDHIALKYPDIDSMRVLFETNRLIDYVFYLCQAKQKDEEIYIQYVHANQEIYKPLDFSDLPSDEIKNVSDWEMPLSFLKLRNILQYCSRENHPVSYRICLPKGDLKNKEAFKQLKVIVRTTLNISEFVYA